MATCIVVLTPIPQEAEQVVQQLNKEALCYGGETRALKKAFEKQLKKTQLPMKQHLVGLRSYRQQVKAYTMLTSNAFPKPLTLLNMLTNQNVGGPGMW
ncbi:hypothetical protein ANCDUO_14483 [Ancylostoma duodenale]|uniref:Uncharacterized protein n=1 Tax=Ancylostoma duodenale TaxID=51022 RepID=A0A0C2G3D4_9BILA|nr:hypothetical protein ANCDUO_14483 [Ancylostoma duodenale]